MLTNLEQPSLIHEIWTYSRIWHREKWKIGKRSFF